MYLYCTKYLQIKGYSSKRNRNHNSDIMIYILLKLISTAIICHIKLVTSFSPVQSSQLDRERVRTHLHKLT